MAEGFTDPVVRCTECQYLIDREEIQKFGCCPECGNRRVRNVMSLSPGERDRLRNAGQDEFLALFEEVA